MTQTVSRATVTSTPTDQHDAWLGVLVDDRYRLDERLGQGSAAEVFAGQDVSLGRAVVVKVFDSAIAADPAQRRRFQQQSSKAAQLIHPHIAAVFDAGFWTDADGREHPYVVTEPAGSVSLRDLLDRRGRLTPRQAVSIAAQVADALEYAHRHGTLHADVKPQNVLVDPRTGMAKLVDFSLSFVVARTGLMTAETVARRAPYLAPEQVRGEPVSEASDVYGLGAVLYEMLVGRPPFIGATPAQTAERRVHEAARPISAFEPTIPRDIEAILDRALAREPAQRWPSMAEPRRELQRLLGGEVRPQTVSDADMLIVAPVPHRVHRPTSSRRILPLILSAVTIAVVMGIVGSMVSMFRGVGPMFGSVVSPGAPDVLGRSQEVAQSMAAARGFTLSVVGERLTDNAPKGTVIQQTPVAGWQPEQSLLPWNSTGAQPLRVTVSAGMQVPDVRGRTVEDAQSYLTSIGWKVVSVDRGDHPEVPANTIVLQYPAPGDLVDGPGEMQLAAAR